MNKLAVLLAASTLAFTLVARADDGDAKPKKADKAAQKSELLKKYDKNGDGKLDADERKAMREDQQKQKEEQKKKKEKSQ